MSYERGMAAISLQAPQEIPHTQSITHPDWLEYVRKKQGKPKATWHELLDFDSIWSVDLPTISRGLWADMGHAVYQADGSDYRLPQASPWEDLEEIYNLDPVAECGPGDLEAQTEKYKVWRENVRKGDHVIAGGMYNTAVSFAIAAFGWEDLLTFGNKQQVRQEVKRCMDLGRNCPGYFFAVGNYIPPNVPIENAQECMDANFEMRKR